MVKIKNLQVNIEDTLAVADISFEVNSGEILGIVGESGSGKTQTCLAIAGLLSDEAKMSGEIWFDDVCLSSLSERQRRSYNGKNISMIFQEPMTSLNPLLKVGKQIEEVLKLHVKSMSDEERREKVLKVLDEVEIDEPARVYNQYPHELSGGMRQRVVIAIAALLNPRLIIADEPTTSLDSDTAEAILKLILKINKKYNNSVILISHDLKVIKKVCENVLVMKDGVIVEKGTVAQIFENPKEEYTKKLLECAYLEPKKRLDSGDDAGLDVDDEVNVENNLALRVSNVSLYYNHKEKGFFGKKCKDYVLRDISFDVRKGQVVGIVGSSGSGKTTLAKAILGMHKEYDGEIIHFTKSPQMVFQDPFDSLNPSLKVGDIIAEPLRVAGKGKVLGIEKDLGICKSSAIRELVVDMLGKVGLPEEFYDRYPDELSGGQRQRVSIATALINGNEFIVADEPCSALDVTVQKQIMELFLRLQKEMGITILLISHDEELIKAMCDKVVEI